MTHECTVYGQAKLYVLLENGIANEQVRFKALLLPIARMYYNKAQLVA